MTAGPEGVVARPRRAFSNLLRGFCFWSQTVSEARDASLECGGLVRHHGKDIVLNEEIAESAITVRAFSCLDGFRVVVEAPRFTDLKAQLKTMNADPRPRD
jgi:hypothetical protein